MWKKEYNTCNTEYDHTIYEEFCQILETPSPICKRNLVERWKAISMSIKIIDKEFDDCNLYILFEKTLSWPDRESQWSKRYLFECL